jgi:hypothetical protein
MILTVIRDNFLEQRQPVGLCNSDATEPEGSSSHSQQPATGPYPEPTLSTLHTQPISLRSILIPSFRLRLGLPSGLFPSGFPTKTLYTFLSNLQKGLATKIS